MFQSGSSNNFYGTAVPSGAGYISTTNPNGDPCDRYYNIMLDPRLVSPYTGNYNLRDNSPCIDAGDPAFGQDPDGTAPDIGALYFFQCPVFITMEPRSACIIIPASGGSFTWDLTLESNYHDAYTFDLWLMATLPNGNSYGPLGSRTGLTIPSGATITRAIQQSVPGAAPAGFLELIGIVGFTPDSIMDTDTIPFMKLMGDGENPFLNQEDWNIEGLWDETSQMAPEEFNLLSVSPNPFNPETHLSYTLDQAGQVTLAVYDVQGKEVARLADDWQAAGEYNYSFNAGNLPSGVYFATLNAAGSQTTQKLLLLK